MLDFITLLEWQNPGWLWLALVPWLTWLFHWWLLHSKQRQQEQAYADQHLLPWVTASVNHQYRWWQYLSRYWRHAAYAIAWLLFAMSMAGPRVLVAEHALSKQHYTQLMVILDVSRSMSARDITPSRLERAKLELEDLVSRAQQLKIGIVIYAGMSHLLLPPTDDKTVLRHAIRNIRSAMLPTEGSNLAHALALANASITSVNAAHALLIISDGGIPSTHNDYLVTLLEQAEQIARKGTSIYCLGMATRQATAIQDATGNWLAYENKPVLSSLDDELLKSISQAGNGVYQAVSQTDSEWTILYDQHIKQLAKTYTSSADTQLNEWHELFTWFLVPAIILLILTQLRFRNIHPGHTMSVVLLVGFINFIDISELRADNINSYQSAYQAYSQQQYRKALQLFERIPGYEGRMGEASSAYQLKEYMKAQALFTQAVIDAYDDARRARAIFNLANSHYQQQEYKLAITLYKQSLLYDASLSQAKQNIELATLKQKQAESIEQTTGQVRQGRGPRTARAPHNTEITTGSVSLGDEPDTPFAIPSLSSQTAKTGEGAAISDITTTQPVINKLQEITDSQWVYQPSSRMDITQKVQTLEIDQAQLWQRVFEIEEGFPAPLDVPRAREGMPPW